MCVAVALHFVVFVIFLLLHLWKSYVFSLISCGFRRNQFDFALVTVTTPSLDKQRYFFLEIDSLGRKVVERVDAKANWISCERWEKREKHYECNCTLSTHRLLHHDMNRPPLDVRRIISSISSSVGSIGSIHFDRRHLAIIGTGKTCRQREQIRSLIVDASLICRRWCELLFIIMFSMNVTPAVCVWWIVSYGCDVLYSIYRMWRGRWNNTTCKCVNCTRREIFFFSFFFRRILAFVWRAQ